MVRLVQLVVMVVATVIAANFIAKSARAQGDGLRVGPVYSIAEPDMLEEIQSKLSQFKESGALKQWQEQAIAKAKKSIEEPKPLGLPRAFAARSWLIDPTYVVPQDMSDGQGHTFAHAGDRINPLQRGVSLRQPLVFLDARDGQQIAMAKTWSSQLPIKVILVAGRWSQASEALGQRVYFDQRGALIKRFGIQAVPAVVEQDGDQLRVSEIVQ